MQIKVPQLSLVVMVGVSGSGKSSFARKHFKPTEIISSDGCRALVSDDENNQSATSDASELLHFMAAKRLKRGLLTVIDATNVQAEARKPLVQLAREHHCLPVAIVLNIQERICEKRNNERPDRNFGSHVLRQQSSQLRKAIGNLKKEGFRHIYVLNSPEEVDAVDNILRDPLYNDKRHETGPFDIIGDVHGCFDELQQLMLRLGYAIHRVQDDGKNFGFSVKPPEGRRAIFLGDLVDRGPDSPGVLRLVMSMVGNGTAFCVPGNHDVKLLKKLNGADVQPKHGLALTLEQLEKESPEFITGVRDFIDGLISHYALDGGNLVVAHAGLKESMQGRGSGAVRAFCLYGETTGETDEFGLPVRYNWALEYRGQAMVVYGHTPVPEAQWLNRTIDIDTGCVFGGKLTALRYPERELVSVPAIKMWCEPAKPLHPVAEALTVQQEHDDLLDLDDVIGKRFISTRLRHSITVREENSIAALEVMSRFAVNPKWLIYLPPTMSPCETSEEEDYLEHPREALDYFSKRGIRQVVCEEKHMGSRAVLVVCRDESSVTKRFGITGEGTGICYTRNGRNFFTDKETEKIFLDRVNAALTTTGFWEKFNTDWVCLDAELMPWSAKAQSLLKDQYAAVGASAGAALPAAVEALDKALARGIGDAAPFRERFRQRQESMDKFVKAYRQYCWPVNSPDDYCLAPFHILATENAVHVDKDHAWHMENIKAICEADPILMATPYKVINLEDNASIEDAVKWWLELTDKGGEGMVIKPLDFVSWFKNDPVQPAVKCRGREYLRIIYGPEYTQPENMKRLKNRGISAKRSLAMREFALGVEGLERFVKNEPLRRVHECVFGVLALESEEVDPRL